MEEATFNKVMLIDDNVITNTLHETLLTTSNFAAQILVYDSAPDALNYLKQLISADFPDIIFLDIRMPIMDGFSFLEEYKKINAMAFAKTKIYMLTSSLDLHDFEKASADACVTDFIVKPLTLVALDKIR